MPSATFRIPLKPRQSVRVCRDNLDFLQRVAQPTAKAVRITGNAVVHLPGMKTKQVKMDPELARAMKNQLRAFKKKFGREPGPNDPVFFDPDVDTPQAYTHRKASRDGHRGCKEGRLGPRPSSATIWLRRVRKARHTLDAHFLKYDRFQQQILPRNPTLASDALHFKLQCVVFIPIVVYLSPAPRGQRQCRTLRWTNPSISK